MKQPRLATRLLFTGAVIVIAAIACWFLYLRITRHPWTRDAQVRANIILIAPQVTGKVMEVAVSDNQRVSKGDLLFRIDPADYELARQSARVQLDSARQQVAALEAAIVAAEAGVEQAEASVVSARARVRSARAQVDSAEGQLSAAEAARRSAQSAIDRSQAALEQSVRNRDRAQKLAEDGAGSVASAESRAAAVKESEAMLEGARADLEGAEARLSQGRAGLRQAEAGLASAEAGLGEAEAQLESARAGLTQAQANLGPPGDDNPRIQSAQVALARAELDLGRVEILAPTDGYATNLSVDIGDLAMAGSPLLAFVDSASFHVKGFFQETQVGHIAPGDRAQITLMSHRDQQLEGEVESIGWAINPPNVATMEGAGGLVPQVQPSFDWIRLAQRVPVRIRILSVPEGIQLVSGTTASVVVRPE